MVSQWLDIVQAISSLLAVLIATIAMVVTIRAENRAAKRFQADIALQERIAKANLRPLLAVFTAEFTDNKGIVLLNAGIGTAVITDIVFSKDSKTARSVSHLFDLPEGIQWDNSWYFRPRKHYLSAGKSIDLVRLTASNLLRQGISETELKRILDAWQDQMPGISVNIKYEDVLGNRQDDYEITLE
jgi:hypothetical protein